MKHFSTTPLMVELIFKGLIPGGSPAANGHGGVVDDLGKKVGGRFAPGLPI